MNQTSAIKRLLIARHGNTFETGQTPTRVGARTDLPLTKKGEAQASALGTYIEQHHGTLNAIYAGELKRAHHTAEIALANMTANSQQPDLPISPLAIFNEIDYGIDENKTDDIVIDRIGAEALQQWDESAIVPPGWNVNPDNIIRNWLHFSQKLLENNRLKHTLVVTSNGIARFAPYITGDFEHFKANHPLKMSTGGISSFIYHDDCWQVEYWNQRPAIN